MAAIQERIASRMSQIVGLLHYVMQKESDATLHNLIHLLTSVADDPEFRTLVCSDAVNNPVAMDMARRIEEGFESAGRNVRPRIATLTDADQKLSALKTLIRYVQHLLTLAKQGERVRYMLNAVTGTLRADGVAARAKNAAMDPDVIELFFHMERGLEELGVRVSPEMPALREMFAHYRTRVPAVDGPAS